LCVFFWCSVTIAVAAPKLARLAALQPAKKPDMTEDENVPPLSLVQASSRVAIHPWRVQAALAYGAYLAILNGAVGPPAVVAWAATDGWFLPAAASLISRYTAAQAPAGPPLWYAPAAADNLGRITSVTANPIGPNGQATSCTESMLALGILHNDPTPVALTGGYVCGHIIAASMAGAPAIGFINDNPRNFMLQTTAANGAHGPYKATEDLARAIRNHAGACVGVGVRVTIAWPNPAALLAAAVRADYIPTGGTYRALIPTVCWQYFLNDLVNNAGVNLQANEKRAVMRAVANNQPWVENAWVNGAGPYAFSWAVEDGAWAAFAGNPATIAASYLHTCCANPAAALLAAIPLCAANPC